MDDYDKLLGMYLELFDELTGYCFTTKELMAHTTEWDYARLMTEYKLLINRMIAV